MPSTYSSNLRLELVATGEQQGTWGTTTNKNLGTLLEQAICGYASVTVSNAVDTVLTSLDGLSDQSRNMILNLTGTISATRNVICPAIQKLYVVKNATTGGFAVTFKVSGQTGVSIPNGATLFLYVDGTDARQITGTMAAQASNSVAITGGTITGITDLAVADGGTGASDAATARSNLGLVIGTNVQAYDATLQSLSALGTEADRYAYTTGVDTWTQGTITAAGRAILDDADAAAQRTTLGLGSLSTLNTVGTTQIDDNSVNGAKIALGSDAQGDVMYYGGTDWVRLPAGSSGQALRTNGPGANPEWWSVGAPDVILEDQKSANVDGGTFTSGADRTRVLNTEVRDALNICTLSANQFTLPAGTYYMEWCCPAFAVDGHQSMLYNVTGATVVKRGSTAYGSNATSAQTESRGNAVVTVAGSTAFEIRHRCVTTRSTTGFGIAASLGTEIYTNVNIWKVA